MSEFGELKPSDKCGIVAIASTSPVAKDLYYGLRILQHRGQESGGIATFDRGETRSKRGMGLVHEIFRPEDMEHLRGNAGIGHVRYSTTGS
ncbi:MAG: amidophosphoribosyltransferase, partial [Methanobacteriota archaeon]